MRLRRKLALLALLPLAVAVAASAILLKTSNPIREVATTFRTAESMIKAVSDLNLATHLCLATMNEQTEKEWRSKYDALSALLANPPPSPVDDAGIMLDMRRKMADIQTSFAALSGSHRREPITLPADPPGASREQLEREMLMQNQSLMAGALLFVRAGHLEAVSIQETAGEIVVVFSMILAVLLGIVTLAVGVHVSQDISTLQDVMRAFAAGNLDREARVSSNDELGELAAAFNNMRVQLWNSRAALDSECDEHRKTATSLRESNRHLSDLLVRLKRAQQQSIEQERMQALKQIANGIVHDFNSSLTPVLGTTEFLLSSPKALSNPDDVLESLKLIDEGAKTAKNVVHNLSEFFRPTTSEMTDIVSINDLILEAISITKPKWKEQSQVEGATMTIVTDLQKDSLTINANRIEINEALTNLILNAVDAMPTGGTITFRSRSEGDVAVIEISDNGEGMSPEVRSRCFEPFFSTKGPRSSGMGLAVTMGIVSRHKGTLLLNSEPSNGTTVTIRLPIQTAQPARKTRVTDAPKPEPGLRILVVDDEAWSRRVIQRYLADDRCVTETAADGHEALAKLKAAKFDLVILDRAMPDMSGDELAVRVKEATPDMPVIMLTGFGSIMEELGQHPKDVDIVMSKPFTRNDIRTALAAVMEDRRGGPAKS